MALVLLVVLSFPATLVYAEDFKVGDGVLVKWKDAWWDATVESLKNGTYCIHYKNYDRSWDECVGPDRIKAH